MKQSFRGRTYIWQLQDWPGFYWDEEILRPIQERIVHLHGYLAGRMDSLGFDGSSNALLNAMSEEVMSSSEIEGVTLNPQSVRSSIARKLGIEEDGLLIEDHYVDGLVDVMMDAVYNCTTPLSDERLFDWHAALFPSGRSGMYKICVADWRKGEEPMQVVSGALGREKVHYEAPPSAQVASEMKRFIDWYNTAQVSPLLLSGIAHLWFVTVHPFDDGNGRISRTISDMSLARLGSNGKRYYSLSAEINRNKKIYYDLLEKTQKGDLDITEWLRWFLESIEQAIKRTIDSIDNTIEKSKFWDRHRDEEVNERQRKIINRLWDGFEGKLTTSKYAKINHCSQDTALRDFNDLIEKGMLLKSGEGGRSANYLLNN